MYGHTYRKSMDQPGKVASHARGQLTGTLNISLSAFVPENLVSRDGFGSPVPRQPAHLHTYSDRLKLVLTYYRIPPEFRVGVYLFIVNRHTPLGHAMRTDGVRQKSSR